MFSEYLKLRGTINLVAKHSNGVTFCERTIHNTVTTAGKNAVAGLIVTDVSGTAFDAVAIGVGTPGTTALGSESVTNGGTRRSGVNVTGTVPTSGTAQWVTTFTFTGALAITEEGIFNSTTSNAGTMLASQSFSAINVIATDTLQITHQVVMS
jgi:hypothetical protein